MASQREKPAEVHDISLWLLHGGDDDLIDFYTRLEQVSIARAKAAVVALLEAGRASGRIDLEAFTDPNAARREGDPVEYRRVRLLLDARQHPELVGLWKAIPQRSRSMRFIALLRSAFWRFGGEASLMPLSAMVPGADAGVIPEPTPEPQADGGAHGSTGGMLHEPRDADDSPDPEWPGYGEEEASPAEDAHDEPFAAVVDDNQDATQSPAASDSGRPDDGGDVQDDDEFLPDNDPLESLLRSANEDLLFDDET